MAIPTEFQFHSLDAELHGSCAFGNRITIECRHLADEAPERGELVWSVLNTLRVKSCGSGVTPFHRQRMFVKRKPFILFAEEPQLPRSNTHIPNFPS